MTFRCPTSHVQAGDGRYSTIVGCGSTTVAPPDEEGLCDCRDCGVWFDPVAEGQLVAATPTPEQGEQ